MKDEDLLLIHKHLRSELSSDEKELFESKLNSDIKFQERARFELNVYESLDEKSWSFIHKTNSLKIAEYQRLFQSTDSQNLKKVILKTQNEYYQQSKSNSKWYVYAIVASMIALASIFFFPNEENYEELYSIYLEKTELMALVDRSRQDSLLSSAQVSFDNNNFYKVIDLLSKELENTKNSNVYLYLAISQMETDNYQNSESTLNKLINSDLLDAQKGYWFKSLLYLKSNRVKDAKKELDYIVQNNYFNKDKALELREKLD